MSNYLTRTLQTPTPQSEPLEGYDQVKNSAGGYVFEIDDFKRLERFLVLGSEGGTYYVKERPLTIDNISAVKRAIEEDGVRVINIVREFSSAGRIPKNSTALFVLAVASAIGDERTKEAAADAFSAIARTGSHLFEFIEYADSMRGWGRGFRKMLASWYTSRSVSSLAYQFVKYRTRNSWSHRDVLRKTHPSDTERDAIFAYVTQGTLPPDTEEYAMIHAYEAAKTADVPGLVELITEHNLPREAVPNQYLTDEKIWRALLPDMPMTALFRNLVNMTRVGLIKPMSDEATFVANKLVSEEDLKRGRIHPIQALSALTAYKAGGLRRTNDWTPIQQIVDSLEDSVSLSFNTVEPTGARFYLGVDVSGSMGWGTIAGTNLTPRAAAAVMSLVIAKTERNYVIKGFQAASNFSYGRRANAQMLDLGITARDTIAQAMHKADSQTFGGTDCALPMIDALEHRIPVDCFVVLTDNETWAGETHPVKALERYRKEMGINAKLIVVGMTSTGFSIADPADINTLDIVGFDASAPRIIQEFVKS